MAIDIDDVCTHDQLADEVGGAAVLAELLPDEWASDSAKARQASLDRVLSALARRTPPIREEDLRDVTELRRAVLMGAAEHVYRMGMHAPDDAFGTRQKVYERDFWGELNGLNPTLSDGAQGAVMSIGFFRR